MPTPADVLARALTTDSARPLLTFYDDATGERTELSVATFGNWAAKTANLLVDELGVAPGSRVAVRLPLHWQAAVWLQAAWLCGLTVDLGSGGEVDVAVITHDDDDAPPADEVVSLGLGPMGLARPGVQPAYADALDYDRSVHSHGDRFALTAPTPAPALTGAGRDVSWASLLASAEASPTMPEGGRLLVTEAYDSLGAIVGGLLVPLLTGASVVLCRHLDEAGLSDRIGQENLVATLGEARGGLPGFRPAERGIA